MKRSKLDDEDTTEFCENHTYVGRLQHEVKIIHGVHDEVDTQHKQVRLLVIGAGMRGNMYSQYAKDFPSRLKVVGVAEPKDVRRVSFQKRFSIEDQNVFITWKDAASREKFADAVVIATLDDMHHGPCLAFAELGYHILCEKPMAPTEEECKEMVEAAKRNGVILCLGHVLRYTNEFMTVKKLITDGAIGKVVGIHHLEPVGWWHFAHSYVRGNWKQELHGSGSLMAKSCHDFDLIKYFLGDIKCRKIQSFGALTYFNSDNKPSDASSRCLDCKIERSCPYSAVRRYIDCVKEHGPDRFCCTVCEDPTVENLTNALRNGPYGKCVYDSDNDVCDYQTVNMEFDGGRYATFTMSAFTKEVCVRKIRIMGTHGEIECDAKGFRLFDFRSEQTSEYVSTSPKEPTRMTGHGFADYHLIKAFVKAVALDDPLVIESGAEDSLRGHRLVFAAEKSRRSGGTMLEVNI